MNARDYYPSMSCPTNRSPGSYLVHNHVRPQKPLNGNGFRAWIQTKSDNLVRCRCRFGGCKNAKVHKVHYRVDRDDLERVRATS